jgi:two-component system, sensor histidine kinase and response regulator
MSTSSPLILVVEDTYTLRQLAVSTLVKSGYRVLEAENGQLGYEMALKHSPDVAICDINMPILDGFGFVAKAREHPALATLPILMLTSLNDRESVRRAMSTGADDYLTKPWSKTELRGAIKSLIDKSLRYRADSDRAMNQLRNAVLATIPHELRTPLTSILGLTELMLLRRGRYSEQRLYDMIENVHGSALGLTRTIKRMMDWSELSSGSPGVRLTRHPLPVAETVTEWLAGPVFKAEISAALKEPQAASEPGSIQGHALQLRLEPANVSCDPMDFQRILNELVTNAVRFSKPNMPVGITGRLTPDGRYAIEVANVGLPIPKEFLDQMGALAQADRHRHEQQGVGLGLAMSQLSALRNGASVALTNLSGIPAVVRISLELFNANEPTPA